MAADDRALGAHLHDARIVDIEGGGIPLPDQMPEAFARAVEAFLRGDPDCATKPYGRLSDGTYRSGSAGDYLRMVKLESAKRRGLHDAKAPIRRHPGVNAAGLRAAAGCDPGRDPVLGPDAGDGAQPPPRLRRWCASPWRAPRMARASRSAANAWPASLLRAASLRDCDNCV
ncbi:MAG: hypothetical protein NTW15_04125 [Burkholderiales bacterium]|nr:hypothetical protein [Burkholderiales bacterium]